MDYDAALKSYEDALRHFNEALISKLPHGEPEPLPPAMPKPPANMDTSRMSFDSIGLAKPPSRRRGPSLGDLAQRIVADQIAAVLLLVDMLQTSDKINAELIHNMRVELRRLRNAINTYRDVLLFQDLQGTQKMINRALKLLGKPRDLDVLSGLLRNLTKAAFKKSEQDKPTISKKEQRNTVSKRLEAVSEERSVALKVADEYIRSEDAAALFGSLKAWAESPAVQGPAATDEAEAAVPRMLAPRILEVVEYPSWAIGAAGVLKQPKPVDKAESWAALLGVRPKKCERMHDLRKEIREVRYLMEGVETLYVGNDDFQTTKNMLIKRQKVLGDLHDLEVLMEYIVTDATTIPTVIDFIKNQYRNGWLQWNLLEEEDPITTEKPREFMLSAVKFQS